MEGVAVNQTRSVKMQPCLKIHRAADPPNEGRLPFGGSADGQTGEWNPVFE